MPARGVEEPRELLPIAISSEAAKAIVRRNTEEVQGAGRFDVFDDSSPTISPITRRSRTLLQTRQAYENSTRMFVPHSPTFMRRSTGNLPMVTE